MSERSIVYEKGSPTRKDKQKYIDAYSLLIDD
jgi:hypothetical protein